MASEKLLEMLNQAISMEIQVSIQYMWQHVQWGGIKHFAVSDELEDIAIQEMKHAEKIAERLWYLGGKPTTKPAPITVGENLWEMITSDIDAEMGAIKLYKEIVKVAAEEGDVTTKFIFEGILEEEEEHHDFFISVAEDNEMKK
ncbi:MAG: ferritin [Methanomassiliicoccus sp.]|nr:ferritin [Methanomassiliicoccus sp.]